MCGGRRSRKNKTFGGGSGEMAGGGGVTKNMTGGSAKNYNVNKIKCVGGGRRRFFPVRPPLRISNGIALKLFRQTCFTVGTSHMRKNIDFWAYGFFHLSI